MAAPGKPLHESVTDDQKIEWLGDLPGDMSYVLASKRMECELLHNKPGLDLLDKLYRAWAARNGRRFITVADIAKREDATKIASEMTAPRRPV